MGNRRDTRTGGAGGVASLPSAPPPVRVAPPRTARRPRPVPAASSLRSPVNVPVATVAAVPARVGLPGPGDGAPVGPWRGDDEAVSRAWAAPQERRPREAAHALQVMDTTDQGVLILDTAGECEYVNDAACRLLGRPKADLEGADVHGWLHGDEHDLLGCPTLLPCWDGLSVDGVDGVWLTDTGRLPVHVHATPLIVGGLVQSVVIMFADASEMERRRRAEAAARHSLQRAVAQAEELAQHKTDFVNTISHELRTPLTAILGFAEVALEADLPDDARDAVEIVERNARRLLRQVQDLLTVSRIESGTLEVHLEPVPVQAAVRAAVDAVTPAATNGNVTVIVDAPPDLVVTADPERLDQVLVNLLSNAVKFTPAHGTVTVTVTRSGDGDVVVEVADTGIGIPVDDLPRLFTRFYRASTSRERAIPGTGLGLAISRDLVDRMGGSVSVRSAVDVGTAITLSLPRGAIS